METIPLCDRNDDVSCILLTWNKGFVHLEATFNRLHKAKKYRKNKNKNCHPKCIPLNAVPPISPPLIDSLGLCVIITLFQYHQSVSPVKEIINITVCLTQAPTPQKPWVDCTRLILSDCLSMTLGEEELNRLQSFFDQTLRQERAACCIRRFNNSDRGLTLPDTLKR